jgi:hypothetical protein
MRTARIEYYTGSCLAVFPVVERRELEKAVVDSRHCQAARPLLRLHRGRIQFVDAVLAANWENTLCEESLLAGTEYWHLVYRMVFED